MVFFESFPTYMDFDGQGRAEKYSRFIITLFGVVGLVWGYIIQQFSQTVYILGAGFVLAALVSAGFFLHLGALFLRLQRLICATSIREKLVTIPPWPMYRRKNLQWQKVRPENDYHTESSGKSKKKK